MQFGSLFALLAAFLILAHGEDDKKDLGDLITCEKGSQCKCDKSEPPTITCDHVIFKDEDGDDEGLTTANLQLKDKATFKVVKLTNNNIRSLIKKEIVPTLVNSVEELDFSNNEIQLIDGKAFDDFGKLKVLKLSHNHLEFDDMKNVFTSKLGERLDRLDLDYNKQLRDVPEDFFDKLTKLRKLVLDGNGKLELTDKTFGKGMKNLEDLSLDDCNIDELPDGIFDGLPKLNKLSLRGNPLDKIPDVIKKIKNLKILDLSETKINMIESCAFCGLEELKIIYFTNCTQLSSIDDDAFGSKSKKNPPKLEEVHFDNCNLITLHENLVNWEDLKQISIGGNPLNCDCDLKWLLENPHLQTFNGVTPTCAQPESLKDMPLNKANDKVCPQAKSKAKINTRLFFLSFVFFILVIAAIFGFIQYTRRRGRLTNVFYRPELPQMSYNNLPANPDLLSENYTYSIQQDTPAEEL